MMVRVEPVSCSYGCPLETHEIGGRVRSSYPNYPRARQFERSAQKRMPHKTSCRGLKRRFGNVGINQEGRSPAERASGAAFGGWNLWKGVRVRGTAPEPNQNPSE